MSLAIETLNAMSAEDFIHALGGIFEHSPWVAASVVDARPFASIEQLHSAMCAVLRNADGEDRLHLICAHPELAGKAAIRGELTDHSTREQHAAGLDQCTPEEFSELTQLNAEYRERFGFPFILAVRGHTRASILAALRTRMHRTREEELAESLAQIERIAASRLGL
ncbi:2-oxo-4-hydroxy-4-carboxy-5-ureidoimidazoline decarboxylase [Chiayiivirga flava]|uniref:2-oxo-4-hydroxy-4-carboxy-5-ureidoimidazoline decarboxylase n=1 Tax=Chiayiivirga flava TaxID=659595 RepID=A0A7W8D7W1_9GAMM|nr:2-oxo-4-hydroxy-4-carboxy-5-ureidoimidazoline decarboxylase [Chiayiivirga flava]MBB5209217.1 2-oxo-4-hydroxy-4-carboxy-5-ureidoimidazoline decarboxylase [Chiayiivirga flava]